jgi:hypothetical protein
MGAAEGGLMGRQLDLFAPATPARRPPDLAFIRKRLHYLLRLARQAERMTQSWEERFPKLADYLPEQEAHELKAAFAAELSRLRAVE